MYMHDNFVSLRTKSFVKCLTKFSLISIGILKHILFIGDQLTVEGARGSQDVRVNSETTEEALLGLEPAVADWHAEANYLQVLATS